MGWKGFLFGYPSEKDAIEGEWKEASNSIRKSLDEHLRPLEEERERLAGIADSEAIPFDVRLKRLNDVEKLIQKAYDDAADEEDVEWFKKSDALKQDEMKSSNIVRRIMLWMYWHM